MIASVQRATQPFDVRLRPIALPVEHGGWSLLLEPVLLGLLLAPSVAGFVLTFGAVGAFLARHSLKVAIGDWRRKRQTQRTRLATRFALLYTATAALLMTVAVSLIGINLLIPLLIAAAIFLVQFFFDINGRSRALVAELAGSIAAGVLATSIAVCGGWSLGQALLLWPLMTVRSVPTVLYLRCRLRLLHRKSASIPLVILVHALALVAVLVMVMLRVAPFLTIIAVSVLLIRAIAGFSKSNREVTAKKLGVREIVFGAVTIVLIVIGFVFNW